MFVRQQVVFRHTEPKMRLPIAVRMPSPASKATFPAAYSLQTIEPATPLYGLSATAKAIGAGMCAYRFLSGSITKNYYRWSAAGSVKTAANAAGFSVASRSPAGQQSRCQAVAGR